MRRGKSRPESRDYRSYFGKLNASSCEPTVKMSMHGAGEEPTSGESPEPFRAGHLRSDTFLQLACDGGNKVLPRRRAAPGLPAVGRSDVGVRHDEVYAGTFSKQARCGVRIDMKPARVKLLAGDIYKPAEAARKLLSHNFLRRKPRFSAFSLRSER